MNYDFESEDHRLFSSFSNGVWLAVRMVEGWAFYHPVLYLMLPLGVVEAFTHMVVDLCNQSRPGPVQVDVEGGWWYHHYPWQDEPLPEPFILKHSHGVFTAIEVHDEGVFSSPFQLEVGSHVPCALNPTNNNVPCCKSPIEMYQHCFGVGSDIFQ